MRRRLIALAGALLMLCGCGQSARSGPVARVPVGRRVRAPVRLRVTPAWVRDACAGFPVSLRDYCPLAIPAARDRGLAMSAYFAERKDRFNRLELDTGSESANQRANRPPRLVRGVLASGDIEQAFSGLLPQSDGAPVPVRDRLASSVGRKPLALGERRWTGLDGELSLAPGTGPVGSSSSFSRFLFFRWNDAMGSHSFGLRAWDPLQEAVRTLHALIDRVAALPARRFAYPPRNAEPGSAPMARSPSWLHSACRSLLGSSTCPRLVPATSASSVDLFYVPSGRARACCPHYLLSVEWGTPGNTPASTRPPGFAHLDIEAGGLATARVKAPSQ